MAEVLLRRHLSDAGVDATVSSAGLYEGGAPATNHGVAAMADRGLDLQHHRSRRMTIEMLRGADLVLGMARMHVREAAVLLPEVLERAFTLKELSRAAGILGPRAAGEDLATWLRRANAIRDRRALVGIGHDDELDVDDPVGRGRGDYEITADLIDQLLAGVVARAFPAPLTQEQRA